MLRKIFGTQERTGTAVTQISPIQLQQLFDNKEQFLLVDVRTPREYEQDGHVAGSRLIPLSVLQDRISELPEDKKIIFICRSGGRSQTACDHMTHTGHTNIVNLSGGMMAWKRANLPFQ